MSELIITKLVVRQVMYCAWLLGDDIRFSAIILMNFS